MKTSRDESNKIGEGYTIKQGCRWVHKKTKLEFKNGFLCIIAFAFSKTIIVCLKNGEERTKRQKYIQIWFSFSNVGNTYTHCAFAPLTYPSKKIIKDDRTTQIKQINKRIYNLTNAS